MAQQFFTRLAVGIGLALAATSLTSCAPAAIPAEPPPCTNAQVTLLPHPDDEWQAWGLREALECPVNVALLFTRGEQSAFCDLEPRAEAKYSEACANLRLESWLGFYEAMLDAEPTGEATVVSLEDESVGARDDDGVGVMPGDPLVWKQGSDVLIAFDLGDGDLTVEEVQWATDTVLGNPEAFMLDTDFVADAFIGPYYYSGNDKKCFVYEHEDHLAVVDVLKSVEFGDAHRYAPTCASDVRDEVVQVTVSDEAQQVAWGDGGAFKHAYGWLGDWMTLAEGERQDELFHSAQSYWVLPLTSVNAG